MGASLSRSGLRGRVCRCGASSTTIPTSRAPQPSNPKLSFSFFLIPLIRGNWGCFRGFEVVPAGLRTVPAVVTDLLSWAIPQPEHLPERALWASLASVQATGES